MKSPELGTTGQMIAAAAIAAPITFFVTRDLPRPDIALTGMQAAAAAVWLPLAWIANVLLHELGHLAAAFLVSFRPLLFKVGRLAVVRDARRVRLQPAQGWGGMVLAVPGNAVNIRFRYLSFIAAGPLATLCAAMGSYVLMRATALEFVLHHEVLEGAAALWFVALGIFCACAVMMLIIAIVPALNDGYRTDGAWLLSIWQRPNEMFEAQAIFTIGLESLDGVRPADWKHVEAALRLDPATPNGALARLIAHWQAVDRGDIAAARAYLDEAMAHREHLAGDGKRVLLFAACVLAAVHEGDGKSARRWLSEDPGGTLPLATYRPYLVEAVTRIAEGRPDAMEPLLEAERRLPDAIDTGFARMDADLIARLKAQLAGSAQPEYTS